VVLAHRSAEIDEFVDIVHDAGFPHDAQPNDRTAQGSDGEAVGVGGAKYMIRRSAPSAALDKFNDDGRISWNIFAQIENYGLNPRPGRTTGIVVNDFYGLALIKRSLGKNRVRSQTELQQDGDKQH
jgi:hypothetical protein